MSGLLDDLEPATVAAANPPTLPPAPKPPKSLLDDLEPVNLAPRAASGALESIQAGFQGSAPGLAWRGKLPDLVMDPQHASWWERALSGAAHVGSELPLMIGGAIAGAPAGAALGTAVAPGVGTAVGSLLGAGAGMGAVPAAIRQTLIEAYKSGDVMTAADFWNSVREVAKTTATEAGINAAAMGAGAVAGRVVGKAIAPAIGQSISVPTAIRTIEAADLATQIAAMPTIPAALQGRLPDAQEFVDAAILIGGLKAAHVTAANVTSVFLKTGKTPAEQVADAQANPEVAKQMAEGKPERPAEPEYVPPSRMEMLKVQENLFTETARLDEMAAKAEAAPLSDPERLEMNALKARVLDLENQLRAGAPELSRTPTYTADQFVEARKQADTRLAELTTKAETEALTDTERAERVFLSNSLDRPTALAKHFGFEPILTERPTPQAIDASAQRLHDDVLQQLKDADEARKSAGLEPLGDDHAQAVAALVRARVRTRAERLGVLPESLYAERPVKIEDVNKLQGEPEPAPAAEPGTIAPEAPAAAGPELDLFGEPIQPEAPAPRMEVQNLATQEIPLANLILSKDVPQFKMQANKEGVVQPLGGLFDRTGVGPIQVWERLDGTLEVISGRHRLDLARRSGEQTIPAQIHREADGFDQRQAATLDAQLNIREEQGSVADYAQYFKDAGIDKATAEQRGLLARAKGRTGFAIARDASPDLLASHRAGRLSDEAALVISSTAPGSERLQALGIAAVQDGKTLLYASNLMRSVDMMAAERMMAGEQGDIFGFDDSALKEASAMAKKASSKQRAISEQIAAVSGASKRPELARKMGVNVEDPAAVQAKIVELKNEQYLWDNWPLYPELVKHLRGEVMKQDQVDQSIIDQFSIDPKKVEPGQWAGRVMFHGTSTEGAVSITGEGINNEKSNSGYFGPGIYLASDHTLARDNYAEFSDDATGGKVVAIRIKPDARILDLRDPNDWDTYVKISGGGKDVSRPDFDQQMVKAGVDGLFDRSFGGVVIYNPKAVQALRIGGKQLFQDPVDKPETPAEAASRDQEAAAIENRKIHGEKDLIIQHNVTGANLLHAAKMGGIPVPSLAITKAKDSMTNFGEITLIGDAAMADPLGYAKTKVFGADIYSPRYPTIQYKISDAKYDSLKKKLDVALRETGSSLDSDEMTNRGPAGLENAPAVMYAFLKSKGEEPNVIKEKRPEQDQLAKLKEAGFEPYFPEPGKYYDAQRIGNDEKFQQLVVDYETKQYADAGMPEFAKKMAELDEDGRIRSARLFAANVLGRAGLPDKPDQYATRDALRTQIGDERRPEFVDFAQNLFDSLGASERIFMGFTNSGNRSYKAHTIENIVNILKKDLRGGEGFNYGVGSLRAKFTPQFRSVAQIKANKDRLLSKADFEKVKKEVDENLMEIWNDLAPYSSRGKEFGFGDTVIAVLEDAKTMGIDKALKEYDITDVPQETKQVMAEFLTKLRHLPTEYFEAKITRAVDLSEFKAAVVPSDASPKVVDLLQKHGVEVVPYERGNEEARKAAVNEVAMRRPDLLFQDQKRQWYRSALGEAIQNANMKAAPAKGWHDFLKGQVAKGGVKADEIKWSGVEDWLKLQDSMTKWMPAIKLVGGRDDGKILTKEGATVHGHINYKAADHKGLKDTIPGFIRGDGTFMSSVDAQTDASQRGKITKQQVADYLASNGVKVEEVMLGDQQRGGFDVIQRALREEGYDIERDGIAEDAGITYLDQEGDPIEFQDLPPNLQEVVNRNADAAGNEPTGTTKFGTYQLPGGENYRELLLTLPASKDPLQQAAAAVEAAQQAYEADRSTENYAALTRARDAANKAGAEWKPNTFQSSHFDQPNILAHIRFNERTDAEGKKVLFVEEIQSDWAQKGKKEGFKDQLPAGYEAKQVEGGWAIEDQEGIRIGGTHPTRLDAIASVPGERNRIPAAPFVGKTDAWVSLAMKRVIRYAAENGFDKVAWTRGEQQVERYSSALRKAVDVIEWKKTPEGVQLIGYKGSDAPVTIDAALRRQAVEALGRNDMLGFDNASEALHAIESHRDWRDRWHIEDPNDVTRIERHMADVTSAREAAKAQKRKVVDTTEKEDNLSDAIGKAMADQIRNDPNQTGTIEGDQITVSDTGMAGFYDKIVPKVAKEVLKKLGGGMVGEVKIPVDTFVESKTLSPEENARWLELNGMNNRGELAGRANRAMTQEWIALTEKRRAGEAMEEQQSTQPGFDITETMREGAMKGQPLFQKQTDQLHRGSYDIAENLVTTLQGADKSTVVHELTHSWLEEMKADAARPDAPASIKADWEIIRRELAIPETGEISRASHEQFARTGERYLAEGEAPSRELQSVFARFREWLLDIYKSVMNLNVEINPELRQVLDRMLATDEEIAAARDLGVPRAYVPEAAAAAKDAIVPPPEARPARRKINPGFEAEQASMQPYADELPTGPGEAPDNIHVNYAYINTPTDVKLAMQRMAEIDQANIQRQRGGTEGVKSWAEANAEQAKYLNDILGGGPDTLHLFEPRDPDAPHVDVRLGILKKLAVGAAKDSARLRDVVLQAGHDATVRQQLEYMGSIERARMIQAEFLGERASVARALNALKDVTEGTGEIGRMLEAIGLGDEGKLFQAGRTPAEEQAYLKAKLDEILQNYKGKTVLDIAKLHKEIGTLKGTFKMAKEVSEATTWDKIVEGWRAGLLSGPVTHTTNLLGTEAFHVMRPAVDALATIIGMARGASPGMGESDRASMSEAVARLTGMLGGVQDGIKVAIAEFKADEATGKTEAYRTAIPGQAGRIIRTPLRLMGAEDALVTTMYTRGEIRTLAIRQAFDEDLNPSTREFAERVSYLQDNPTPEMQVAAETAATRMTFNAPLGEKGVALQGFVNKWNLQWMIPFVRTPINIAKELLRMSPFAPAIGEWRQAFAKGGVERDRALAEMALGSGIMAITMAYAFSNDDKGRQRLTGSGGPDPGKNRGKAGVWQPYSILIGDTYYEYARIQPTGTLMGMAADMAAIWDHMTDEEKDKVPKMLSAAFAQAITNQTFLQGIANFVNALSDPTRFGPRFLQSMAGSMVPNIIGQPTTMADPVVREVNSALEAIQARIPGMRQDLLPKRDWLGEPVKTKERVGMVMPIREQQVSDDKVRLEAARLDISMAAAPRKTHIGKGTGKLGDVKLTPEERDAFEKIGGEFAHGILQNIVNAPGYDQMPDMVKRKIFSNVLTAAHRVAAVQAMPMEKRIAYLQEITEKVQQELTPGDAP